MPLYELEQLLDLVRLGLSVNFLEIQELRDSWVHEDVVAPAHATEAEPERLCERAGLGEPEVVRGGKRLLEELSRVHWLNHKPSTPASRRLIEAAFLRAGLRLEIAMEAGGWMSMGW